MSNLNALRMFDAAARHLNFRLAAEEVNLTQGAVAQQVRRLEQDLGLKLFDRQARGLALTEVGRDYHGPVRRGLAIIDDATRKLRPEQSASITLSVTPSFASKWLVPRLSRLAETHPEINLRTVASERLADFRTDGVDIAIRQGRPSAAPGLEITLLAPLNLCAVCSPAYAEKAGPIERFEDFSKHRLVQDSHAFWETLFEGAGLRADHRIMQFNQTALAMDAAANGQGMALVPRLFIENELARGNLVLLWQEMREDQGGFYLIHPTIRKPNPARDAIMAWIRTEIG